MKRRKIHIYLRRIDRKGQLGVGVKMERSRGDESKYHITTALNRILNIITL